MDRKNTPKIAVVGAGYWGPNIIRNLMQISPSALAWICDCSNSRLKEIGRKYPDVKLSDSLEPILDDPTIDGVMLALPPEEHPAVSLRVLEAGKHLFVEKPAALDLQKVLQISKKAEQVQRIFMVGLIYRYHEMVIEIRRLLKSGRLGSVTHALSWRKHTNPRPKVANILWSLLPHDLTIFRYWFGESPDAIAAKAKTIAGHEMEDNAQVRMTFASGIESQVFLSLVEPVKTRMIALIGSEGALVFDEIANPGVMLLYPKQNLPKGWQQTAKDPKEFLRMLGEPEETYGPEISPNEPLNNECRHFLDCLKTHKQPLTGGEEATEVTRLILAALESLSDR